MNTINTPEEAFELLTQEFPDTSVCAKRQVDNFFARRKRISWTLTAFTCQSHCEQGNGDTFEEALENLRVEFHGSDPIKRLAEEAEAHGMKLVPA